MHALENSPGEMGLDSSTLFLSLAINNASAKNNQSINQSINQYSFNCKEWLYQLTQPHPVCQKLLFRLYTKAAEIND